jgi:hypothetical protein
MPNSENVYIPGPTPGGYAWVGGDGAVLPTDSATELEGFIDLGFLDENGYSETQARENQDLKAFGGVVVKSKQTSYAATFKMVFLEMSDTVLKLVYGPDKVEGSGNDTVVTGSAKELPERTFVIETLLDDTTKERLVIPRGKITSIDEIVYNAKDPVKYGVTISALVFNGADAYTRYKSAVVG